MPYQGQLWGGPGHGNLVEAVYRFRYQQKETMYLDGPYEPPAVNVIAGEYQWDGDKFVWDGPGADGDTIERIRLR